MDIRHLKEACKWLGYLRSGTDQYDACIRFIHEDARKGNFSLLSIGTSEEELEELRVKGCEIAARKWLGYLRNDTKYHHLFIECFREEVRKGNFSLLSIGTSEEELSSLAKASA